MKLANVSITVRFFCKYYLAHFAYFVVSRTFTLLANFIKALQMFDNVILVF